MTEVTVTTQKVSVGLRNWVKANKLCEGESFDHALRRILREKANVEVPA